MGRNARAYYERYFGRERSVSRIVAILEAAGNGGNGDGQKRRTREPSKAEMCTSEPRMKNIYARRRSMKRSAVWFDRKWLAATGIAALAVLAATHIPQEMMPKELQVRMLDKVEHAVSYGVIAFFGLMSFRRPLSFKVMTLILLAGALVGAVDEVTQPLVHRTASVVDWAADLAGIAIACGVFGLLRLRRREPRAPAPLHSALQT